MSEHFKSLVDLWERSCNKYARRTLFGTKSGESWHWTTYDAFKTLVDQCRTGLAALGVGPGDKVAIIANNQVEWAVAAYATYGRRAIFVPMYQAQKVDEWQFILDDCGAKLVIAATNDIHRELLRVQDAVKSLEHVIGCELAESHPHSYNTLLQRGKDTPVPVEHPSGSDIASFMYTSGTTGNPKGVILSHDNICSNINAVHAIFPFENDDRSLSFLPWAHAFGQTCELHALLSMGASIGINDSVANLVANLAVVKPTVLFAVPHVFNRIYDGLNSQMMEKPGFIQALFRSAIKTAIRRANGQDASVLERISLALADKIIFSKIREKFGGRLKYAISGGAALSKEVAEFIDSLGIQIYEGYGLTETSPIATANYPGHRKIGSVGKPIPGVKITIDREVTGAPEHGEIIIKGPNVMQGYHNRHAENDKVLMSDRSFRSGDTGFLDDDGYLFITGRIKEQYKLENGRYVIPAPIEEEIKLSPFIANVMLYGANKSHNVALVVPDQSAIERWASESRVELTDDLARNTRVRDLLRKELEARSSRFKSFERPKDCVIVLQDFTTDNGMLTPTLKLKRYNVLEKYESQLDALYRPKM